MKPSRGELTAINEREKVGQPRKYPFVKLEVRDRKREGWTFVLKFTAENGKTTLETCQTQSLRDALQLRRVKQRKVNDRKRDQEALDRYYPPLKRHTRPLKLVIADYLAHREATRSDSTVYADKTAVELLEEVLDVSTRTATSEADSIAAETWMAKAVRRWSNPRTVNMYLRHLKTFGTYLERHEYARSNPFKGVSTLREPDLPPKILSKTQVEGLYKECEKDPYDWNLLAVVDGPGCRISEALRLEWNVDIVLEGEMPTLRLFGKFSKAREIALVGTVKEAILEQKSSLKSLGLRVRMYSLTGGRISQPFGWASPSSLIQPGPLLGVESGGDGGSGLKRWDAITLHCTTSGTPSQPTTHLAISRRSPRFLGTPRSRSPLPTSTRTIRNKLSC